MTKLQLESVQVRAVLRLADPQGTTRDCRRTAGDGEATEHAGSLAFCFSVSTADGCGVSECNRVLLESSVELSLSSLDK